MAETFEVDSRGKDARNAAKAILGFMVEKFGEAELLREASDRPLIKSGSNEVVVEKVGTKLKVSFGGGDITEKEVRRALGSSQPAGNGFEFGEDRQTPPLFDIILFRGQTAIVRSGRAIKGEVVMSGLELPDALEEVFQESGLSKDDLTTVHRRTRTSSVTIAPLVKPDEVSESTVLAAVETPGLAELILDTKPDDPNVEFVDVGDPMNKDFVVKPFSKEEARYRERGDPQFDKSHEPCRDCAHFDGHGNCLIVPNIRPDEYCEEFFSDYGVFGDQKGNVNLEVMGEDFDKEWSSSIRNRFSKAVRETLLGE